jgi:ABC-type xylose transport system substrate-binding protein
MKKISDAIVLQVIKNRATAVAMQKSGNAFDDIKEVIESDFLSENDISESEGVLNSGLDIALIQNMRADAMRDLISEIENSELKVADINDLSIDGISDIVLTFNDEKVAHVQFERETNRLHADFDTFIAAIYCEWSSDDLTDEHRKMVFDCDAVKQRIKELDAD